MKMKTFIMEQDDPLDLLTKLGSFWQLMVLNWQYRYSHNEFINSIYQKEYAMKTKRINSLLSGILILVFTSLACNMSAVQPTSTSASTDTPQPTAAITLTPTNTPKPSPTPRPTKTPNLAPTKRSDEFNAETQSYFDKGYFNPVDGKITEIDDFTYDWAQLGWYNWQQLDTKTSNFYMSAHF